MGEGKLQMPNNIENLSDWRTLREEAPMLAKTILEQEGFEIHIGTNTLEALRQVVEGLPAVIKELSYDEAGEVKNKNRFVVRALTNFREYANDLQKKAANDTTNPLAQIAQNG